MIEVLPGFMDYINEDNPTSFYDGDNQENFVHWADTQDQYNLEEDVYTYGRYYGLREGQRNDSFLLNQPQRNKMG